MQTPPRTSRLYIAVLVLVTLALLVFVQAAFNLNPFIRVSEPDQIVQLFILSTFIFLSLIIFGFVLLRTIVKLWLERRTGKPGAKFKTKLVSALIVLAMVPATALVFFAFGLVNRSIDKWFSVPVDEVFRATDEMTGLIRAGQESEALRIVNLLADGGPELLERVRADLGGAVLLQLAADGRLVRRTGTAEVPVDELRTFALGKLGQASSAVAERPPFWVGSRRVNWTDGTEIIVSILPPQARVQELLETIAYQRESYRVLIQNRIYYRDIYVYILVLITLLVLFAAVWTGLFLSRKFTGPIEALSEATREISRGNLAHRVQMRAEDELGMLVDHFNDMAGRLEATTAELESRRKYMEIILESIPSGVISMNQDLRINRMNRAAQTMFSRDSAVLLEELLTGNDLESVRSVIQEISANGRSTVTREIEFQTSGRPALSSVTASRLPSGGAVLVIEDLTEIVRAQKETAWREVARRLAHEIKNPLTPIQLSAERIGRNVTRIPAVTPRITQIVGECVENIVGEVTSLKRLVDEFVRFSRLPGVTRGPESLRSLLDKTLGLYEDRMDGIVVEIDVPVDLPSVLIDASQMKRVLVNLIDNALAALSGTTEPRLTLSGTLVREGKMVRLTITDNGRGIPEAERGRLFTPYFSTKPEGTGLGLAISSRIVAEHAGSISAEAAPGSGTRFIIELPVCTES